MHRFLFLALGVSLLFPIEAAWSVSLSVWTHQKKKEQEQKNVESGKRSSSDNTQTDYLPVVLNNPEDEEDPNDFPDEAQGEPESSIEHITLDDGRQVLRVKNGPNTQATMTKTDTQGTVQEIVKNTHAGSRDFVNTTPNPQEISGSGYYPYYPSEKETEDKGTQTDMKPLTPPLKPSKIRPAQSDHGTQTTDTGN